ncbi:MAG: hypothetical protein U1E17_05935 [Geminicoccaceae bacterium]
MPFGPRPAPTCSTASGDALLGEAAGVWPLDDANIPRRLEPVPVLWRLDAARLADRAPVLDHNFQGWSGTARIDLARAWALADHRRRPALAPSRGVPPGMDFFCVEPVSQVADGFNLLADGVADTGVQILGPGRDPQGCGAPTPASPAARTLTSGRRSAQAQGSPRRIYQGAPAGIEQPTHEEGHRAHGSTAWRPAQPSVCPAGLAGCATATARHGSTARHGRCCWQRS